ncbi:MAG: tetratricopeptide repeat protein [Alteromonadaceae bacterium]|nr:tetratricopeptide repeat protein [Alteromonadaceae bacterium]
MSVINQMLKDLEQRDNKSAPVGQIQNASTAVSHSPKTLILVAIIVIVLINSIGIFVWKLYSENQSLKLAANANFEEKLIKQAKLSSVLSLKPTVVNNKKVTSVNDSSSEQTSKQTSQQETQVSVASNTVDTLNATKNTELEKDYSRKIGERVEGEQKVSDEKAEVIRATDNASFIKNSLSNNSLSNNKLSNNKLSNNKLSNNSLSKSPVSKSSMAVTRREIRPEDLAAQKMSQAKEAIELNKLEKAERLFEDILLLKPRDKDARKQLAALWFGRQDYQAALNLLSQGIVIDGLDSEFRLMKARIYLSLGEPQQAYQNLKGLAQTKDIEYQLALANTAQQIENFSAAINAYKVLLVMQPDVGRWWLGLAVAFDRNSEFEHAIPAYRTALEKGDLSASAVEFSKQRLQELGE